jgi:hypothetical protein
LTIDKSPEALRRLADQLHEPGSCPYCNRDPYHYVNNGVGQERVAVVCCEPGIELFQHGRETDEPKTLEYEAAATLRALAERAAPAPAGDLVSVLVATARPLVMPAGWADKELTAAFEVALAVIAMAGYAVVPMSERMVAATVEMNERLIRDLDSARAERDRYQGEAVRREADAARLREALKPFAQAWEVALKACSTSSLSDFGAVAKNHVEAIRFQRAHAALATKEPGDG